MTTPALLRSSRLPHGREDPDAALARDGGRGRTVMVICSAATVAAAVVLAVAGRLA
ncbi:hypothetical protein ACKI1S_43765 [Streptomyces galilaeus]|uniref:TIGR02234 family membrane protein n=1 Tax=Streptomyces galilaeus TaxID=33899 RepID=A0ABW9IX33_STRGJ